MLRFDVDVDDDEKEESEDEYEENEDELGVPVVVFFFVVLLSLLLRLRFVVLLSPSSSSTRLYFSLPTLSTCSVSNDFPEPRDPIKRTELFSDSSNVRSSSSCSSHCCRVRPTTLLDVDLLWLQSDRRFRQSPTTVRNATRFGGTT